VQNKLQQRRPAERLFPIFNWHGVHQYRSLYDIWNKGIVRAFLMLSCDFMISVVAHSINANATETQLNLVETETFQVRAHIKQLRC